jgi:hypothetical protein
MIAAVIVPLSVAEHSGTPLCWCTAWHATIAEHHARGLSCRALGTHNSLVCVCVCVCVCVPDVSHALPTQTGPNAFVVGGTGNLDLCDLFCIR